ncbi:MAG: right-handed parallel beta-helix repeat-containing protein [Phycisphaerae bacterium]|nr:right-handed parallel beta-helix repeat-containing protein [Phycisphaerae bacterium]
MKKAALFLIVVLAPALCGARIITVDDNTPADFNNIQAAIDDANDGDTVEIQPGTYTGPGNRDIDFLGKRITVCSIDPNDPNTVSQTIIDCNGTSGDPHRGFHFHSKEDANSVLAGLTVTNCLMGPGAGVYCEDSSPLITNCTFSNSSGQSVIYQRYPDNGGTLRIVKCAITGNWAMGVYCDAGPEVLRINLTDCVISGSMFDGVYSDHRGRPVEISITGCVISNNGGTGVANFNGAMSDCTISGNSDMGVSEFNGTISNCTISDNSKAGISGGGGSLNNCIVSENAGNAGVYRFNGDISNCVVRGNYSSGIANCVGTISGCTIIDNTAGFGGGGGIRCAGIGTEEGELTRISDCVISGNSTIGSGGGIYCSNYSPEIVNCIITRNQVLDSANPTTGGGAIATLRLVSPIIRNCTITENSGKIANAILCLGNVTITNCVIWGNVGPRPIALRQDSTLNISWSDLEYGQSKVSLQPDCTLNWGPGNIDADPCFVDVDDRDYRLKSQAGRFDPNNDSWVLDDVTSPCIDVGDPMTPIMHEPFPNGGIVNMGVYGGTAEASKSHFGKPPCEIIVAGDINGDCEVSFLDFRLMAVHWLKDR